MTITLNGEAYHLNAPLSVAALLDTLGIDRRRVAVEHNLVVVRRALFESTVIGDGDEVEIVNFVGGGETGAGSSVQRSLVRPGSSVLSPGCVRGPRS